MTWMNDIKVVVFDLDGTLYQDYRFLGRYVQHLLKGTLSEQEIEEQVKTAYAILEGNHAVRLGYFYNRENGHAYAHDNFIPTTAYSFESLLIPEETGAISDDELFFFLGDPWCIAQMLADKYEVPISKRNEAFEAVRFEMLQQPYEIYGHAPLFDSIADLPIEKKVLMTNTPGVTGPAFVEYLNIGSLFDAYLFDAKKPTGMQSIVKGFLDEGYKPHEILSIGDNPFNDLAPVQQLGGRTCLISPYVHYGANDWDHCVKTVEDLARFLSRQSALKI